MGNDFFVISVFLQGMASFLSPCVLPLIPAYLTYLTGQSLETLAHDKKAHKTLTMNSIAFVLGFSIVFILLGAIATKLGSFMLAYQYTIQRISGVLIILFGLFHTGLIPIKALNYERRLNVKPSRRGFIPSLLIGMGFSIGWTPCIGPVLASVLILAANTQTVLLGMLYLAVYALGLGIPFLILAVGARYLLKYLKGIHKYMNLIKIISGVILIIIGLMIFFNVFAYLVY
ncbi:MAG TPA: cytochrome c biogenesis protein CcdA [Bacillota bacterium]|nr:cytochrome c biogenesis protein CcdA [Bacillota bacterium]